MKKGFIQNINHSRMFLSGISALFMKQRDPRLQTSGMVSGFTLIELLVVVLIIGILSAIALPQYQKAVLRAHMTQGIVISRAIAAAEVNYCLANNMLTKDFRDLDVQLPGGTNFSADYSYGAVGEFSYNIWLNGEKTVGTVSSCYKGICYLQDFNSTCKLSTRQCRAETTDSRGQELCISMGGSYMDTYGTKKSYYLP